MSTLADIEALTKDYAVAREALSGAVSALEEEIAAAKRRYLPKIKRCVAAAADRRGALAAAIEDGCELFSKPRTQTFHGIRVGVMKGKGGLEWEDADRVVALIERHFPDQVELLIKVRKTPVKDALAQLSAADLKRIGVTIIETGDQLVIRPTDSEVDRLVEALLKDAEEEVEA
ncbi:MAG: hypothetical protein HYU77_13715 [Betaproteobacteria bacterium]|nr:hypothetical protein [Betaproteobacteria bacterium]